MKLKLLLIAIILPLISFSQNVTGRWKTIDDVTGNEKSYVEIYEQDGKIYAKILQLLTPGDEDKVCEQCEGDNKDKPVKGMIVIDGLSKDGKEWNGGTILDPKNGKVYKCYITLENDDKLKIRGYIGFSLLGRTQYWYRMK
ncbi:MAG TPA: DUF2147 domain-containing protein [Lutibacter sp.]|nr:DUF2147 domain-containing protein [Lutibacter sp.]